MIIIVSLGFVPLTLWLLRRNLCLPDPRIILPVHTKCIVFGTLTLSYVLA